MILACLVLMWAFAFILYKAGEVSCNVFCGKNIFLWSGVNILVFHLLLGFSGGRFVVLVATVYLVTTAMIDEQTGYVYSVFSYLAILLILSVLFCKGIMGEIDCYVYFFFYLKVLEQMKVYGGGDTEYLMFLYCLERLLIGERAEVVTIVILLVSVVFHILWHCRDYGKRMPFTPTLLAAAMVILKFMA